MALSTQRVFFVTASLVACTACGGSKAEAQSPTQQPAGTYTPQQGAPQQAPQGYQAQPGQYPQQAPAAGQYPQQPAQTYPQQQPYPQQSYPQQPATQPAAQQPATQPAPGQVAIPGFSLPGMAAPAQGQAQAIDASMAAPAQALIVQLASADVPAGAKPLGALVAGNFSTGSSLETQIQLQPGKCYTVVGAGLPGVSELNLEFVGISPLPTMSPVLAQDQTTGPQAVLGQKPNCYRWAFPAPAPVKLVITVAGGSGIAGAQVFEK